MSTTPPTETPSKPEDLLRPLATHYARILLGLLLVALVGRAFVLEGCPVHGPSMQPTLEPQERVLVLKLPVLLSHLPGLSWLDPIAPGDLVVFESRDEANKRYVKRVIAEGPPSAAGNAINARAEGLSGPSPDAVNVKYEYGRVFVNEQPVDEKYLVAEERESPMTYETWLEAGEYFVLGDHRSVSRDSLRFGPVHEDQIIGKAVFRIWPLSKFGPL
jgi:signal peptidase I